MKMTVKEQQVSRRHMMKLLAALGITGPAAAQLVAQSKKQVSPETLRVATAILDHDFSDERLKVIATALQRNLDQFQIVRDLVIDDMVEPAPIFQARMGDMYGRR